MPREDDDGPLEEGTPAAASNAPKPAGQPKSKFNSILLRDAERVGMSQQEIDECENNSELRSMIVHMRKMAQDQHTRQPGRGGDRDTVPQTTASPPPPPAAEPEWELGQGSDVLGDEIKAELKRLGGHLLKATKKGDKDRVEALEEEIAELKAEREREKFKNSPFMRKVNRVLAKYEALFGTEEEREENPTGRKAQQFRWLDEAMTEKKKQGKLTGDVERDLQTTIAQLFPGAESGGTDAAPAPRPAKPASTQTRAEAWSDAGTPPASHRNGAERAGKPGGKRAAAAKIREKLREDGYDTGDDSDDLDDEDDI